jgi:hypothetical protein
LAYTLDTYSRESCKGFATSYLRVCRCEWTLRDRSGRVRFAPSQERITGGEYLIKSGIQ